MTAPPEASRVIALSPHRKETMRIYHVGLLMAGRKVIVEMRRKIDFLSPDLWIYYGRRETTKKQIREKRIALLQAINKEHGTQFDKIEVD